MGWRGLLGRLLSVGLLGVALLRVEFCKYEGYSVTPLGVTAHFALTRMSLVPPQAQHIGRKFLSAMAAPYEIAVDQGLITPKKKSTKKKAYSLEKKANEWLNSQKNNGRMKKFLEDNTFAISGAIIAFFGMLLSLLFPYEAFQNVLLGLGCFWFGANGAHGADTKFSNEFWGLIGVLALALFLLAEPSSSKDSKAKKDSKKHGHSHAGKKCEEDDEWDDGIGGVTAEERRQRGDAGGCCGGH